jgi:hypothetical protein
MTSPRHVVPVVGSRRRLQSPRIAVPEESAMPRRPAEVSTPIHAVEDRALAACVVAEHRLAGITGGSALLDVDGRLLAVHDDAFRVSWIALPSLSVTPLVLASDGARLAKADKPDFESALRTADGAIHLLGSGSTAKRCTLARIDPRTSAVTLREHPRLYECVRAALQSSEPPNVEGALVDGDRLRLFNRAAARTPNASVDVPLAVLEGGEPRVLALAPFELGALDGVRLGFTDVAALGTRRSAFVAAAEDAPDAIADGRVTGSVVGLLEATAAGPSARWTRLVDADGRPCPYKVEGVTVDRDSRGGWLLTDSDDPGTPAALLRVELRGFG